MRQIGGERQAALYSAADAGSGAARRRPAHFQVSPGCRDEQEREDQMAWQEDALSRGGSVDAAELAAQVLNGETRLTQVRLP